MYIKLAYCILFIDFFMSNKLILLFVLLITKSFSQSEFILYQPEFLQHINNPAKIAGNKFAILGGVQETNNNKLLNYKYELVSGYFNFAKNTSCGINFTTLKYNFNTYKNTSVNFQLAYQVPFEDYDNYDYDNEEKILNLGLSVKYNQFVTDYSGIQLYDKIDQNFPLYPISTKVLDFTSGFLLRLNFFKLGASTSSLRGLILNNAGLPYNNVDEIEIGLLIKQKNSLNDIYNPILFTYDYRKERKKIKRTYSINFRYRRKKINNSNNFIPQYEFSFGILSRRKKISFETYYRFDNEISDNISSFGVSFNILLHKNNRNVTVGEAMKKTNWIFSLGQNSFSNMKGMNNISYFGGIQKYYLEEENYLNDFIEYTNLDDLKPGQKISDFLSVLISSRKKSKNNSNDENKATIPIDNNQKNVQIKSKEEEIVKNKPQIIKFAIDEKKECISLNNNITYKSKKNQSDTLGMTFSHNIEVKDLKLIFKNNWIKNEEIFETRDYKEGDNFFDWVFLKQDYDSVYEVTLKAYNKRGKCVAEIIQNFRPFNSAIDKICDEK